MLTSCSRRFSGCTQTANTRVPGSDLPPFRESSESTVVTSGQKETWIMAQRSTSASIEPGAGGLILLVEDNPDDELLTIAALRDTGTPHRVDVVNDGAEV